MMFVTFIYCKAFGIQTQVALLCENEESSRVSGKSNDVCMKVPSGTSVAGTTVGGSFTTAVSNSFLGLWNRSHGCRFVII